MSTIFARHYPALQATVDRFWDATKRRDDDRRDWLDDEAKALASRTFEVTDLARCIADHEEFALLDRLLDAHRYGVGIEAAWDDLKTGLIDSMAKRIRTDLARSRGWQE